MEELDNWLEVWNVDGYEKEYQEVEAMRTALMNGNVSFMSFFHIYA